MIQRKQNKKEVLEVVNDLIESILNKYLQHREEDWTTINDDDFEGFESDDLNASDAEFLVVSN